MRVAVELAQLLTDSLRRPERTRASGYLWLGLSEAGLGRWRRAAAHFDRAEALSPAWAFVFRALITATNPIASETADLQDLKSQLLAWDGVVPPDELSLPGGMFGVPGAVKPHLRQYLLGLVEGRLGEVALALAYADSLRGGPAMPDSATVVHDIAQEVEALALWTGGDVAGALEAVEAAQFNAGWADVISAYMFNTRPHGRLLPRRTVAAVGSRSGRRDVVRCVWQ